MKSDGVFATQMRNATETSTGGLEVRAGFWVFIFVAVFEHITGLFGLLCTHYVCTQRQIVCVPGPRIMPLFVRGFVLVDMCAFSGLIIFQLTFASSTELKSTRAGPGQLLTIAEASISVTPAH